MPMDLLRPSHIARQGSRAEARLARMEDRSSISPFSRLSLAGVKSLTIRRGACTTTTRTGVAIWGPTPLSYADTRRRAALIRTSAQWPTTASKNCTILRNSKRNSARHSRRLRLKDFTSQITHSQRLRRRRKKVRPSDVTHIY